MFGCVAVGCWLLGVAGARDAHFGLGCTSGVMAFLMMIIGDAGGCFSFGVLIVACVGASV